MDSVAKPSHGHHHDRSGGHAYENLYPAIVQCFFIILAGYIAGRFNLISSNQSKGIGTFISKFALPALVLKSMIELKFETVNWKFLSSLLIGKSIVFFLVIIFTLILTRLNRLGKAGIFAIFATQSNDFALGYPIIQALYEQSNPDFLQYIYLAAPISFMILNPIGFTLLEIDHQRTASSSSDGATTTSRRTGAIILHVVRGVVLNPIVLMTIVGIIANFIFHHNIPNIISGILVVLANSFSATALFFLGLSLVGKVQTQLGTALITPSLLIFAKLVLLPFIIREFVIVFDAGANSTITDELSSFGFLYGTIPSAPTVFIYATQYNIVTDLIASGMVVCTFISAPFMFLSANMVTLSQKSSEEYTQTIKTTSFDISILGLICCFWVIIVLTLNRRFKNIPHQMTFCLVIAQGVSCIGMILVFAIDSTVMWQHYIQFILFFIGTMSARCWTAMVAMAVCLLRVRSLCCVLRLRVWMMFFGFGLPTIITGVMLMFVRKDEDLGDMLFQYGEVQSIVSLVILIICTVTAISCLVIQHRHDRNKLHHHHDDNDEFFDSTKLIRSPAGRNCPSAINSPVDGAGDCNDCDNCESPIKSIEDLVPDTTLPKSRGVKRQTYGAAASTATSATIPPSSSTSVECKLTPGGSSSECSSCSSEFGVVSVNGQTLEEQTCLLETNCSQEQRRLCIMRLRRYNLQTSVGGILGDELVTQRISEYQLTRHLVLILLLILSMFIGIVLCIWRMSNEVMGGVYVELEFLDAAFNFGQSCFVFVTFGLDTDLIILPFVKRWRRFWYGVEEIHLPQEEDLDSEITQTRDQFKKYHLSNCQAEIVADKRYRFRLYRNVFTGTDLVDWLLRVGLASGRMEAIAYGRRLLLSRVLHHVTREHLFYDLPYFYRFAEYGDLDNETVDIIECPRTVTVGGCRQQILSGNTV
ncbi:lysosomal cholesterol signaling protein-like [Tubulanus polymorphus]|uniref:lysosomal cholesterol signaling protein-like n=1 Tax=Tubulanus polymorphus TaxID=672921 RepID=UPI003DA3140B